MEVLYKKSYVSFGSTRMVNNAVFVSKDLSSESEDDEQSECFSIASTLKHEMDPYNSDSSTSTTIAKINPKKREYDPQAYQKWLKTKNETERKRKEKEQARKKREEMRKKLEDESRKEQAEQKWKQWMERKKQEELETKKIKEQQKKTESKNGTHFGYQNSKKWIPNDESVSNFKVWLGRVNQHDEKKKLRSLAQQRKEEVLKQQRLDLAKAKYDEWLKSSKSKPKPVPMNRGIESLRGTISSIFVNPKPWQSNLE